MIAAELSRMDSSTDDDDLNHWFCDCMPDVALCGASLDPADVLADDDPDPECIVCEDLVDLPCERCGQ